MPEARGGRSSRRGEREGKRGTLPLHTLYRYPALMGDQNLPHNIEAQARPPGLGGVERLKNP
jgi:hypothetical protein